MRRAPSQERQIVVAEGGKSPDEALDVEDGAATRTFDDRRDETLQASTGHSHPYA